MDDRRFEQMLSRLLRADFSAGTEAFRDELLARCLAILDADVRDEAAGSESGCRVVELDDADLELLAAAGDGACAGEPAAPESGRW